MDDFGSDMFDTLRGRGDGSAHPNHGFHPWLFMVRSFQDHSIEASINVGVIYLIHRPRSGQTINSHW